MAVNVVLLADGLAFGREHAGVKLPYRGPSSVR
ncbi:hypothetical protein SIN8267_03250 [Sinobacterium norvegicum]|uniref:Uncharacterized protein n=1 Tax=Sinobacterium norvegicum TaxID=1641715 RepID=A0ABM9AIR0_9GAMM|nr:hypothetical protein SIN8267_03250 [Sinobacterium norvegicum]